MLDGSLKELYAKDGTQVLGLVSGPPRVAVPEICSCQSVASLCPHPSKGAHGLPLSEREPLHPPILSPFLSPWSQDSGESKSKIKKKKRTRYPRKLNGT